ncbi:MAG: hypothetical protein IKZ49_01615 [Alphaproteobacteria bacterium]|nr:hypothetical protein [Alphaproteobacteria bacterium]
MKKLLILFALLIIPAVADAAPSVRMLGNNTGAGTSGTKITPAKTSQAILNNVANTSRAGTMRMKTGSSVSGMTSSSNARFPVITSAKVYNNVTPPSNTTNPTTGGTTGGTGGGNLPINTGDVDVNAIVDAVTNRIQNNYYTQQEINNRFNEVNNAITNINQNLDDARFDAIRTSNPRNVRGPAPEGYVYIWIEE